MTTDLEIFREMLYRAGIVHEAERADFHEVGSICIRIPDPGIEGEFSLEEAFNPCCAFIFDSKGRLFVAWAQEKVGI